MEGNILKGPQLIKIHPSIHFLSPLFLHSWLASSLNLTQLSFSSVIIIYTKQQEVVDRWLVWYKLKIFPVHTMCLLLLSPPQVCPGSRTNLSQPHLLSRGTHRRHLRPSVRLRSPRSRATPGSRRTPRRAARRCALKRAALRIPAGLGRNTHSSRASAPPLTWTEDRSVVRRQDSWGCITERRGRERRRAPR